MKTIYKHKNHRIPWFFSQYQWIHMNRGQLDMDMDFSAAYRNWFSCPCSLMSVNCSPISTNFLLISMNICVDIDKHTETGFSEAYLNRVSHQYSLISMNYSLISMNKFPDIDEYTQIQHFQRHTGTEFPPTICWYQCTTIEYGGGIIWRLYMWFSSMPFRPIQLKSKYLRQLKPNWIR